MSQPGQPFEELVVCTSAALQQQLPMASTEPGAGLSAALSKNPGGAWLTVC